jgi:hypothetical protein
MAFDFPGSSIGAGQQIRLYFQFDNYRYAGPKVIQAIPFPTSDLDSDLFLLTSDVGHEQRNGGDRFYYVYYVAIKNVKNSATSFFIAGGGVT